MWSGGRAGGRAAVMACHSVWLGGGIASSDVNRFGGIGLGCLGRYVRGGAVWGNTGSWQKNRDVLYACGSLITYMYVWREYMYRHAEAYDRLRYSHPSTVLEAHKRNTDTASTSFPAMLPVRVVGVVRGVWYRA